MAAMGDEAVPGASLLAGVDTEQLKQLGRAWGEEINTALWKESVGDEGWFETKTAGVIGLNGNFPGKGPALVIEDIATNPVQAVWTAGLTGCMCLAIIGRNKTTGTKDFFFAHARHYDAKNAITDPENPMHMARHFVDSHDGVRVFWGTDFFFGEDASVGQMKRDEAQQKLSTELDIWVRQRDCIVSREFTFFPKLGLAKDGKPATSSEWLKQQQAKGELEPRIEFSRSLALKHFSPDKDIADRLHLKQSTIRIQRYARPRLIHQDSKRDIKLKVLHQVIDAYHSGNFDILWYFAEHAKAGTAPFADAKSDSAWAHTRGESETAQLCIEAYQDALTKIRGYNLTNCGLRADGQRIFDHKEYQQRLEQAQDGPRGEAAHL